MMKRRALHAGIASLLAIAIAGCSGGMHSLPAVGTGGGGGMPAFSGAAMPHPGAPAMSPSLLQPHAKITVSPASLAFIKTGSTAALSVKVTETGATFKEASTCNKIATASPTSGKSPLTVKITPSGAGSCAITFSDASNNKATLPISVTLVSFKLTPASISPNSKSIKIALTKGGTGSLTTTLPTCTSSCTVAGPPTKAGTGVVYLLNIYDKTGGTGNLLATLSSTQTVVVGKANLFSVQLGKVPKTFAWPSLPAATAGTVLAPTQVKLVVNDADGKPISGNYSTLVNVTDSDTSQITQGSSLSVNTGSSSASVSLAKSSDILKLGYKGLAIVPATLTAKATGAANSTTTFTPVLPPIVYTGPTVSNNPEIDLYNPTNGQPGFSASFTLTQPGWRGGAFANNFTYLPGGASNNCSSYSITPSSGASNAYTVSVAQSPAAGTCIVTITGGPTGAGKTLTGNLTLTYTTSGVHIGLRHAKP